LRITDLERRIGVQRGEKEKNEYVDRQTDRNAKAHRQMKGQEERKTVQ
jgi:hypothetical protein